MDKRLFSHINWGLLACMCILFLAGVGNLYSASGTRLEDGLAFSDFYQRHLVWSRLALIGMIGAMSFGYRRLGNLAWPFVWFGRLLLLLGPFIGKAVYGCSAGGLLGV